MQELAGLVVSQGFRAVIKPGSWAASRAADRLVRVAPSFTRDEADRAPGPAVRPPQPLIGEAHSVNGI